MFGAYAADPFIAEISVHIVVDLSFFQATAS